MSESLRDLLAPTDTFARRHLGDDAGETAAMLDVLGYRSLDALVDAAVPPSIRRGALKLPAALGESAALAELRAIASENKVFRSFIGLGYSDTHTPDVYNRFTCSNDDTEGACATGTSIGGGIQRARIQINAGNTVFADGMTGTNPVYSLFYDP